MTITRAPGRTVSEESNLGNNVPKSSNAGYGLSIILLATINVGTAVTFPSAWAIARRLNLTETTSTAEMDVCIGKIIWRTLSDYTSMRWKRLNCKLIEKDIQLTDACFGSGTVGIIEVSLRIGDIVSKLALHPL
jgi:hypothetical protein